MIDSLKEKSVSLTKLIIIIQIINFVIVHSYAWGTDKPNSKTECAHLYSGSNFTDSTLNLTDGKEILDLSQNFLSSKLDGLLENWDNRVGSFRVVPNCALFVCTDSYFDGNCSPFDQDQSELSEEVLRQNISSASCNCISTDCSDDKCDQILLRDNECGRAYLESGCNVCDRVYLSLRPSSVSTVYEATIESIVIKNGCAFTSFDYRDFEGDTVTLHGGIYRNLSSSIGSYECSCNSSANSETYNRTTHAQNINSIHPLMLEMPNSAEDITALIKGSFGKHVGLLSALKSMKNKRNSKNAYIMLLGLTGSGKSATINFLFDNVTIAKVGSTESTTAAIHEYKIPIQVEELGLGNSELRVIDTPGLGDTRGIEYDSQFLATLENFLDNHEDLRTNIPNIVLILARFDDNRFSGDGSSFVKMLRGLDHFRDRLFDKRYSNVIFIFTHFTSLGKKIKKNPKERLDSFKEVIEKFSLFPKPIIMTVAENKPEEEELPMINGFYQLPNKDFYPRNIFEKIQDTCNNGGDPIGEAVIRIAFKNPESFNITEKSYQLVSMDSSKITHFMGLFSEKNFKIEESEISKKLADAYSNLPGDLKRKYLHTLPYLQRSLNTRNIIGLKDVPRTSAGIITLLKTLKQTPAVLALLESALGIKVPALQIDLVTGFGYDILTDKNLPSTPFKFGRSIPSDIVFLLPDILTCNLQNQAVNVYKTFDSREKYRKARLADLTSENLDIGEKLIQGNIVRPGYNIIRSKDSNMTSFVLTAVRETRLFQLTLNEKLDLNDEFKNTVNNLPEFNSKDYNNVQIWKSFFGQYGTHIVRKAHGGGSIEIKLEGDLKLNYINETIEIEKALFQLVQFAENIFDGEITDFNFTESGFKHSVGFKGGDFSFHTADLLQHGIAGSNSLLNSWEESLFLQPIILQTSLNLVPISQIVRKMSGEKSAQIDTAAKSLYNASLIYVPPPIAPTPPPRNETAAMMETLSESFRKTIEELSADLKARDLEMKKFRDEMDERERNANGTRETIASIRDGRIQSATQSFGNIHNGDSKLEEIIRGGYGGDRSFISLVLSFIKTLNQVSRFKAIDFLVDAMNDGNDGCTKEMVSVADYAQGESADRIKNKLKSGIRLLIWGEIVTLKSRKTELMLDTNERGEIYSRSPDGRSYQRWSLTPSGNRRYFKLRNIQTGGILDSNGKGALYTLGDNAGNNQIWEVVPVDEGNCYFYFKNKASGQILDGNEHGNMYAFAFYNGSPYQHWQLHT